jgi:prephenate dehydrogenase
MKIDQLAIVGVGLLGGSVAMAARAVAARIVGADQSVEVLAQATEAGLIDAGVCSLREAAAADVIVFCTPVDRIAEQVKATARHCRPGTLLTDVGSTKAEIVRGVDGQLPAGVAFVGSHPLAGSEKTGFENARADLFEGRLVFVTPGPATERGALARVCAFWGALGALVEVMDPEEHDQILAVTSHLPHLASSALAAILPPPWRRLTGTGFRDTTRLASGCPASWTAIFRSNRAEVLAALERLTGQLEEFQAALEADDAARIEELLRQGKALRDALPPLSVRG